MSEGTPCSTCKIPKNLVIGQFKKQGTLDKIKTSNSSIFLSGKGPLNWLWAWSVPPLGQPPMIEPCFSISNTLLVAACYRFERRDHISQWVTRCLWHSWANPREAKSRTSVELDLINFLSAHITSIYLRRSSNQHSNCWDNPVKQLMIVHAKEYHIISLYFLMELVLKRPPWPHQHALLFQN